MVFTDLHGKVLAKALSRLLGEADRGAVAFVRCLSPEVVSAMSSSPSISIPGWQIWRVADVEDRQTRSITADRAVEIRENKSDAVLLLVDTSRAGAGMDGIYSAAREIGEESLFKETVRLAEREISRTLSAAHEHYAEVAVKRARGFGGRLSISRWTEFDFLCRAAAESRHPGTLLHLLGLWPVQASEHSDPEEDLTTSRFFVDRLLSRVTASVPPSIRIDQLRLPDASQQPIRELEIFLRNVATKPLLPALAELEGQERLWIHNLKVSGAPDAVEALELLPWRTNTGKVAKWSGLIDDPDGEGPPTLIIKADADKTGEYSKLEVKWRVRPENLDKGAAEYRVSILTDMEEEIASREVTHSGKKEEKCRFSNDDFATLSDDALFSAKVLISVLGNDRIAAVETEEFKVQFGQPASQTTTGVGKKVRALSEGLAELTDRNAVTQLASSAGSVVDSKGYVVMRTPEPGKVFRVFSPPLIREIDRAWAAQGGAIGRWTVKVRGSGARASEPEFIALPRLETVQAAWDRATSVSRKLAERLSTSGGSAGQVFDDKSASFHSVVKEYLLAWTTLLQSGEPRLALANTIEVQSLSGKTIGLIVLPTHPLRLAWLTAYDNLVLHSVFENGARPKDVREEFAFLDGAMFPAFLPGFERNASFVFSDTLGFHAVGMVPDSDKEPKAAIAILARALGESEFADASPNVGKQSASVLGNEIVKYLDCHSNARLLHLHALRPGDGFTIARALGKVQDKLRKNSTEERDDLGHDSELGFVLELYPSDEQRAIAGRYITEAREKRRSGAGILAPEDQWMLESVGLPGGVAMPRLRWARKLGEKPNRPAHLAVAFDTFESKVIACPEPEQPQTPLHAFGMLAFFTRSYVAQPSPLWSSTVASSTDGEKHPADRAHSDRLVRIQESVHQLVLRNLDCSGVAPSLRTEVLPEKARQLRELHGLCDWVVTLDRNAGLEYFDSPREDPGIYDAYVIDCVPERQDLGCLQLITSTSNLDEVRDLLDLALDQMGLSRSRRNAEFLLGHLKALSGRLAIRLTGDKAPTSELIALALCHANSQGATQVDDCWLPLTNGFFIPVDDVPDLLKPLAASSDLEAGTTGSRPDLIYVTVVPRKGLAFQFIEVKYRRHLRTARSTDTLAAIRSQVESLRNRWHSFYAGNDICVSFRALRRAKLARVLHFYADKAHRHHLPDEQYRLINAEIDRMVERGAEYAFATLERPDRGWVFCPDYGGQRPMEIAPSDWGGRIYLFGPELLPDGPAQRVLPLPPDTDDSSGTTSSTAGAALTDDKLCSQDSGCAAGNLGDRAPTLSTVAANDLTLGTDVLSGSEVQWSLTIRGNPHLLIAGLPGMGKTTCLLNICRQMIRSSVRPIVFSFHEDIDEKLTDLVGGVRFIDFDGLGFNPLSVIDRRSRLAYLDVAGAIRDIFTAIYPELGDIQGERLRTAIKASFGEKGWDDPDAGTESLEEPSFDRFLQILRGDPKPDRGLRTLLSRLDELDDYGFFRTRDQSGTLWDSEQPTVIRIHTTQNDNLQKAFAALVFYSLYKDMFRRGIQQAITHAVIFDEAHRAAGLKLIPTMAKECRKYGISLVLASQEAKDFNISLFSAVANYLVLRLTETDAKALVRNVATSQQERLLVDRIKQMERFRALYFTEGKTRPSLISLSA